MVSIVLANIVVAALIMALLWFAIATIQSDKKRERREKKGPSQTDSSCNGCTLCHSSPKHKSTVSEK